MAFLADILGGMQRGLPAAIESFGEGLFSSTRPELAHKMREEEKERLWKEEEQRRREDASMVQLEERLLSERALKEEMFERESGLKRELAEESDAAALERMEQKILIDFYTRLASEGTEAGRAAGVAGLSQHFPFLAQYFEGKAITPEIPTAVPEAGVPQLKQGVIADVPTAKAPKAKAKIPKLLAKEIRVPPEFAELEYALNAADMDPNAQMLIKGDFVKRYLQKKLADPAYQIDGKPYVVGGIWMGNFKDGSARPLTDDKGNPVAHIEVKGSGPTGWWRVNNYRAMQGAKDAVQLVIPPAEPTDPLSQRVGWLEDAINLKIPSSKTFKFGEQGKAIIPRGWWGAKNIPWGPTGIPTPIKDVLTDLGVQYYLDLNIEYNEKDDSWKLAILSDLAPKYKGTAPAVPEGRFEQEPLKPTPLVLKEQVWALALKQAKGDKMKAKEIAVQYLKSKGYDPTKQTTDQPPRKEPPVAAGAPIMPPEAPGGGALFK